MAEKQQQPEQQQPISSEQPDKVLKKTYVCNTCGQTFQSQFVKGVVKCKNPKCGDTIYQKIQTVILKFEPQIRQVCKIPQEKEIVLEDLKNFCAEVFWNEVHIYHDRMTLDATLTRLTNINIIDIPYNFNQVRTEKKEKVKIVGESILEKKDDKGQFDADDV